MQQRFPDDVQASLAHDECAGSRPTRFIIYYPAHRRAEIDRFLVRAERCAERAARCGADPRRAVARQDGDRDARRRRSTTRSCCPSSPATSTVSVIPTIATLDFTTEFGLPPDPGFIACHELVHYVHFEQIDGFWGTLDYVFGDLYTPQIGYDPWFVEGLATHYEAKLSPRRRPPDAGRSSPACSRRRTPAAHRRRRSVDRSAGCRRSAITTSSARCSCGS